MTEPSGRDLLRIGFTTGVVHSVFWSTLIYTVEIFEIVTFDKPVFRVILIGSVLWGLFGVATVIRREKDSIRTGIIDRLAEHYLGIDDVSESAMSGVFNWCWFPFKEVGNLSDPIKGKW